MSGIPRIVAGINGIARNPEVWPQTNQWYTDGGFTAYIRSSRRYLPNLGRIINTLDLANFGVTRPDRFRRGLMRAMFEHAEHTVVAHPLAQAVYVECVLNTEVLLPFLKTRGYVEAAPAYREGEAANWVKVLASL